VYLPPPPGHGHPVSTLSVAVDGVTWSKVTAFADQHKDATVYVVRQLADGRSQVCFGDGVTGARLPTGTGNVTATYRYSPDGPPPLPGRLTTVLQPQPNLTAIVNPVPLKPGTDPESASHTARNAPATVIRLGEVAISPGDCEQVAATVTGVTRVRAYWVWDPDRRLPAITLYIDADEDAAATVSSVQSLLPTATSRMPVTVAHAQPDYLQITGELVRARKSSELDASIEDAAIRALIGPAGLFSANRMGIGQPLYRSQVETALAVDDVSVVRALDIKRTDPGGALAGPAVADGGSSRLDPRPDGCFFSVRKQDLDLRVVTS
jgi:hypothetical protein